MQYLNIANKASLDRLDVEQLTATAVRATEDWLDEEEVGFEPKGGNLLLLHHF